MLAVTGIAGGGPAVCRQGGSSRRGRTRSVAADEIVWGSRFRCMMHIALPQNCLDSYGFCKLALRPPLFRCKAFKAGTVQLPTGGCSR